MSHCLLRAGASQEISRSGSTCRADGCWMRRVSGGFHSLLIPVVSDPCSGAPRSLVFGILPKSLLLPAASFHTLKSSKQPL